MNTINEQVDAKTQKLANDLNQPVILLNLKTVDKGCCLELRKQLSDKSPEKLTVVLQTGGGDIDSAFLISKLLRNHADLLQIIVPLYAKSAGTLICLAANRILLTEISELGPLDTQIFEQKDGGTSGYTSALNGFKALEQVQQHTIETLDIAAKLILARSQMKISEAISLASEFTGQTSGTLYGSLDPQKIGEYARALEIGERYGIMILTRYCGWSPEDAQNVVRHLVKQYPHHGFVIDHDELQMLGLKAEYIQKEHSDDVSKIGDLLLQLESNKIQLYEPSITTDTEVGEQTGSGSGESGE
ncbi:MAG: hypothetical protein ABH846_02470 [Patescibacteria group bacterium]